MQFFVQFCVIFAAIAAAYSASSTWGIRNSTDVAFITKNVFYPAVRNTTQTYFFDIPETYQSNDRVISAIYVQDQFHNSSGPTNILVSGGPGWTYASIQMRPQSGFGLNVTYVVYGNKV